MPRPVWSGTISFGLVAIPIKLFHGVSKKSVSFNQLDDRTMSRIRLKKVSAETGEDVPDEHIVKGYEVSKGRYVVVDPDELEPFIPSATQEHRPRGVRRSRRDRSGVLRHAVHRRSRQDAQAVRAAGQGDGGGRQGGHRSLRHAQQAVRRRASAPQDGKLLMSTMVFADEVVDAGTIDELDVLDDIDVSAKEVKMAEALVDSLSADFDPSKYRDEYREQVLDLIERKAAGEEFELPAPAAEAPKVVDLMAALEASVKARQGRAQAPSGRRAARRCCADDDAPRVAAKPQARAQERREAAQLSHGRTDHRHGRRPSSCR